MKRVAFFISTCLLAVFLPVGLAPASGSTSGLGSKLLTVNDLPSGWSVGTSSSSSSSSSSPPPKCFAGLSSSKSHNPHVEFQKGQDGPQLSETLVSAKGSASQLLATLDSALSSCGTIHYSSDGMNATIAISPVRAARVGDKSNAFKVVVSASILSLPFYVLASEVKNNALAIFTYGGFGQGASNTAPLIQLAKDGVAKLQGKKSPDYGSNLPKAVGQSVKYDDGQGHSATVTLVRVIDPAQSSNQFETPESGDRYVAAEFKIVNTGAAFQPEPTSDATAFDSSAHSYSTSFADIANCPSFADNLTLNQGDVADGCVVFQVPASARISKIEYNEQSGGGSGTWSVPSST